MSILKPKARRHPTRFERWALSPISSFRVGLTGMYMVMSFFGVQSFVAGVPAFNKTAPDGFTAWWTLGVVVGSVIATIGSFSDAKQAERVEIVGAWLLFLTLATYAGSVLYIAYFLGDQSRAAAGSAFVALGVMPAARLLWLMAQLGLKTRTVAIPTDPVVTPHEPDGDAVDPS